MKQHQGPRARAAEEPDRLGAQRLRSRAIVEQRPQRLERIVGSQAGEGARGRARDCPVRVPEQRRKWRERSRAPELPEHFDRAEPGLAGSSRISRGLGELREVLHEAQLADQRLRFVAQIGSGQRRAEEACQRGITADPGPGASLVPGEVFDPVPTRTA